ncbi:MAG: DUF87 domain-containing protein [Deltaproteobacteria bacterium]|nr:DUF87 domain-containing protein [Deltaproteobacteria bacterium]
MTNKIRLADGLCLPLEAVTQTFAILAMRGVGKTHTASVLAEEFCDARLPFAVLDPTGAWWGLRAAADGKGEGYPVTILGGDHADAPLEETAGKVVADMLAEEARPLVLDLSRLSKGAMRRFVADFAERLYEKNRDPLHLIIDEADAFAPQKPRPDETRMLGAIDEIVRRGRIRGLGCTLVTQRSAVLNKDVLTQTEVLVALRTAHPRDRAPVLEWMKVHATPEQLRDVEESLAKLPKGDAWVMSAGWLDLFARVHIRARKTFNSSATPKPGERRIQPAAFARIDPKILQERLSSAIERAKADDPKELRRRIAVLEAELKKAKAAPAPSISEEDILKIRRAATTEVTKQLLANVREAGEKIQSIVDGIVAGVGYAGIMHPIKVTPEKSRIPLEKHRAPRGQRDIPSTRTSSFPSTNEGGKQEAGSSRGLGKGERAILTAIAQYPDGAARDQLSVLTGYKRSSRDTYIHRIREAGFVMEGSDGLFVTDAGMSALGPGFEPLPTGDALREYWMRRLPQGEAAILKILIDLYPDSAARSLLDDKTGYKRSSRDTYLQRLTSRCLVEVLGRGEVRASEDLF